MTPVLFADDMVYIAKDEFNCRISEACSKSYTEKTKIPTNQNIESTNTNINHQRINRVDCFKHLEECNILLSRVLRPS